MSNTPQATTVLLTSVYPAWWSEATTVEIVVEGANVLHCQREGRYMAPVSMHP